MAERPTADEKEAVALGANELLTMQTMGLEIMPTIQGMDRLHLERMMAFSAGMLLAACRWRAAMIGVPLPVLLQQMAAVSIQVAHEPDQVG